MSTKWTFDPPPPSGKLSGGSAAEYGFEGRIDTLVRETLQNSMDAVSDTTKPVDVKYRLIELTGENVESFLDAMQWNELEDHLLSVSTERTGGQEVLKAANEFREVRNDSVGDSEKCLRILIIEDRNTRGLSGGEERSDQESKNPYRSLAFDELFSDKPDENSAGSFGLGKVMLWVFSRFKTVLFSSVPDEPPEGHSGLRFIARTSLPAHWVGADQFTGDGWFGRSYNERGYSEWGAEAHRLTEALCCFRRDDEYGTSIAIVGFREPNEEEERALDDLAEAIRESAIESFWPAMSMRRVSVSVQVEQDFQVTKEIEADPTSIDGYSIACSLYEEHRSDGLEAVERLVEKGDQGLRFVTLSVPERLHPRGSAHPAFDIEFPLIVKLLRDSEVNDRIEDRIFRFRNQGMLVGREQKGQLSVTARPYLAILPTGLAAGDSEEHQRADRFLRAAEPQEHDRWTHKTKEISNNYRTYGLKAALDRFEAEVRSAIREMISIPERSGGMLPNHIRELLKFGNTGGGDEGQFLSTSRAHAKQTDDGWEFGFSCRRLKDVDKDWNIRIRLFLMSDGGRADLSKSIATVESDQAAQIEISDGKAILRMSSDHNSARIRGRTDPSKLSRNALSAAIDIRVDGWEEESNG